MGVKRPAYTAVNLDEERAPGTVLRVRFNEAELKMLEEFKQDLNIAEDSTALKAALEVARNVLQSTFGRELLRWLFKNDRPKLSDRKRF